MISTVVVSRSRWVLGCIGECQDSVVPLSGCPLDDDDGKSMAWSQGRKRGLAWGWPRALEEPEIVPGA